MKHIYLIRHAKSDWSKTGQNDFERGLSPRGKRDILVMANILKEKKIVPDYILSSSAKRAKRTAKGLRKHAGFDQKIVYRKELYMSTPEHIIDVIKTIDNTHKRVFIIGHNPEFTELVNLLLDDSIDTLPTLGIVGIRIAIKRWKKLSPKKARLDFFIYPKLFR